MNGYVWVLEFLNSRGAWEPTIYMRLTEFEAEEMWREGKYSNQEYRIKKYARIGK